MSQDKGLAISKQLLVGLPKDEPKYARLGISTNPFPAGGLAPSNPQIEPWPDIRTKIVGFINSFIETRSSNGLILLGNYGAGKTYHLNYIRVLFESLEYKVRIVHITDPGIHPYHLIRRILLSLGEEEVATMMWGIIGPYLRRQYAHNPHYFDTMVRTSSSSKNAPTKTMQYAMEVVVTKLTEEDWSDHRLFFRTIDRYQIMDRQKLLAAVTLILTNPHEEGFVTEIAQIAENLAAICVYDGVPALERWKAMTEGVGPGSIEPGNEPQFLTALLYLLKQSGFEYFVLLLDEFEKVPQLDRMTDKDARTYLDTMRMLIDQGHQHLPFAYIIASNEQAWTLAVQKIEPLRDRFKVINLPPMIDNTIATYTIKEYLNQVRLMEAGAEHSLAPLPENLLDLIPANARVTTRQLVKLCYELIELAVNRGMDHVSEQLVKEVLALPAPTDLAAEERS